MLDFLEWDCYFCKNYIGFEEKPWKTSKKNIPSSTTINGEIEKKPVENSKKRVCLAYPEGIPIELLNVSKEEGEICNNDIGFIEKSLKRKERKREEKNTTKRIEQLFEKDATIDMIKHSLKFEGVTFRMNAIRALIYQNMVDDEIIAILKDIAINGCKVKFFCYTESDFATAALHILGYKEIPLTYFSQRLFDYKDDIFTKFD